MGDYRLGAGDKIRVVVLQDTEFSGDYEVNATGGISARMLGPVQVAGMTLNQVEEMLRERYRAGGYLVSPRLSVELVSTRPFYIIGEVSRSGAFAYVNCLRVIQAVAIAGGFTRRAAKSRITIKRFYSKTAEEEYVTEDTLVEPGDVIRVPERYF
jgi:polysaccharide export outer membrane protein